MSFKLFAASRLAQSHVHKLWLVLVRKSQISSTETAGKIASVPEPVAMSISVPESNLFMPLLLGAYGV